MAKAAKSSGAIGGKTSGISVAQMLSGVSSAPRPKPLDLSEFNRTRKRAEYSVERKNLLPEYDKVSDYARKGQTKIVDYADERIKPMTLDSALKNISVNYGSNLPSVYAMPMTSSSGNTSFSYNNVSTPYSTSNQPTDYSKF